VNDRLGHDAGDRLLTQVAKRLRSVLRPSDTISRLGGDEFAILCEGIDLEAAEAIADRVARIFSTPFRIDGREISLSTSTGIALTRDPEFDCDRLLGDADAAMYSAKQRGRARHAVFRDELRDRRASTVAAAGPSIGQGSLSRQV
jgi:diguanylate cyclase (GGDEF)-like protein